MTYLGIKSPELREAVLQATGTADKTRVPDNGGNSKSLTLTTPEAISIEEAAKLALIDYDRQREALAEKLGIRLSTLDEEVKAARRVGAPGQGTSVTVEDVVPWPDPVDGEKLLDEMATAIMSHIAMSAVEADTIALWCVYSHAYEPFPVSPRSAFALRRPSVEKPSCFGAYDALSIERLSAMACRLRSFFDWSMHRNLHCSLMSSTTVCPKTKARS
jgi:hypothetical protein